MIILMLMIIPSTLFPDQNRYPKRFSRLYHTNMAKIKNRKVDDYKIKVRVNDTHIDGIALENYNQFYFCKFKHIQLQIQLNIQLHSYKGIQLYIYTDIHLYRYTAIQI